MVLREINDATYSSAFGIDSWYGNFAETQLKLFLVSNFSSPSPCMYQTCFSPRDLLEIVFFQTRGATSETLSSDLEKI